jgi:trans-2,3-dihydro-3-hydroxyanthranilate isomerase
MAFDYVICDVFTDRPLTGNQLAVFPDATAIPDDLLQPLAREINFSETTFVYPTDDPAVADVRVRIFTPAAELPFAGHPTLGTAVVMGEQLGRSTVRLAMAVGVVPVTLDGRSGWMVQPRPTVEAVESGEIEAVLGALGVWDVRLPVERYDVGVRFQYVVVESLEHVLEVTPDLAALARAAGEVGTSVVAEAGSPTQWTSRMFAPGLGVAEDPATGAAAGPLVVHLARHDAVPWGTEIEISQGEVINRPSVLRAVAHGGPEGIDRVEVGGDVVVVGRGSFTL